MAKILLVEDDNNLREIYEARLQAEGYEIVSARDGEEALSVAIKERPDLIISDVMMPKISGFDMLDIIRSTEETKNVKVIMMTALSQAEDRDRATKLGANRYLVKSQVTLEDVARVAKEVLNEDEGKNNNDVNNAKANPVSQAQPVATSPTTNPVGAPTSSSTPEQQNPISVAQAPVPAPPTDVATTPVAPPTKPSVTATKDVIPTTTDTTVTASPPTAPAVTNQEQTASPQTTTTQKDKIGVESSTASSEEVEKEQSAIASQIESSMDSKKQTTDSVTQTQEKTASTGTQATVETEQPTSSKKVIQPLSDLSQSNKPKLDELLVKEKQKEQMSQVASQIIANQPAKQTETSQPTEQTSTITPAQTGTNIDGVVKQQPPEPPANDPSSIAL